MPIGRPRKLSLSKRNDMIIFQNRRSIVTYLFGRILIEGPLYCLSCAPRSGSVGLRRISSRSKGVEFYDYPKAVERPALRQNGKAAFKLAFPSSCLDLTGFHEVSTTTCAQALLILRTDHTLRSVAALLSRLPMPRDHCRSSAYLLGRRLPFG